MWGPSVGGHPPPQSKPDRLCVTERVPFLQVPLNVMQCALLGASSSRVLLESSCHRVHSCSPPALGLGARDGKAQGTGLSCIGSRACPALGLCPCGARGGGPPPCAAEACPGSFAVVPVGAAGSGEKLRFPRIGLVQLSGLGLGLARLSLETWGKPRPVRASLLGSSAVAEMSVRTER